MTRLNGVLEDKCYMAADKAAFFVFGRLVWRYMGFHQREGVVCTLLASRGLITCVCGLYTVLDVCCHYHGWKERKMAV